jgi:hypothetical protein
MSQYRYILFSLLFAGMTCAQAQPIVKINPGASECDVTANPGDPIFQLDATGNVIVTGTIGGTGCSIGGGGGGGTPTFGLNPPAAGVKINGVTTASVAAGSVTNVPLTYQAYNAPSCTVGQPTTTGSCPAITAANAGCTGSGAQLGCSPSAATLSIPTVASMGSNTTCGYTVTASCSGVTSSAVLNVTAQQGSGGNFGIPPVACTNNPVNGLGLTWQKSAMWTWQAGLAKTTVPDATDYRNFYSGPVGTGQLPWPSASSGAKPVIDIVANQYLALGFVVPAGTSLSIAPFYFNVNSASQPVAMAISECPGDFGQQGTHITSTACKSDRTGSGGLQTYLGTAAGTCHLTPGATYYLNMIDSSLPVANGSTAPATACQGGTCSAQVEITF